MPRPNGSKKPDLRVRLADGSCTWELGCTDPAYEMLLLLLDPRSQSVLRLHKSGSVTIDYAPGTAKFSWRWSINDVWASTEG